MSVVPSANQLTTPKRTLLVRAAQPTTQKYDAIVIGSGMSGLTSAAVLGKEGMRVLVLEQHYRPGGYLHRFYRKGGVEFDVGFHYFGAVEKQQVLGRYLDYLGVLDQLELIKLNDEGYDHLIFPDFDFTIPAGEQRYKERLKQQFPNERGVIDTYFKDLQHICDGFAFYRLRTEQNLTHADKWMSLSLDDYLANIGASPRLSLILSGQNPLYGVEPRRTPMALHALVTDTFMQGAYAIRGGGDALAQAMVTKVRSLGGDVLLKRQVTEICVDSSRRVTGVKTDRGEEFLAPIVVSCAHPKITLGLLPDGVLRPGYKRRVAMMEDGVATLSLFLTTQQDLSSYAGRNIYKYEHSDMNHIYENLNRGQEFAFVTVPTAREGRNKSGSHQVIALGFLDWRRVEQWENTCTGERPELYEEFKESQAQQLAELVYQVVPELRGRVESLEAASPLTNRDYARSCKGAAYGIHHSIEQSGRYGLRPRTRVAGLFLTGQSVLMPGVCGVTISAFHTCSLILGTDYLMSRVHGAPKKARTLELTAEDGDG